MQLVLQEVQPHLLRLVNRLYLIQLEDGLGDHPWTRYG